MNFEKKNLAWESSFFGYKVSKISLTSDFDQINSILEFVKQQDDELIILETLNDKISNELGKNSFVENKIEYSFDLINFDESTEIPFHNLITNYENINEIYYLALEAGHQSRFRLDTKMKSFEFEKLYFEWIFKSIKSQFDNEVITLTHNNKHVALITLRYNLNTAQIGLISILPEFRSKGFGRILLNIAKSRAKENKCNTLTVATQDSNLAAKAFYEKNQFMLSNRKNIIHLWKNN